MLKKLNKVAVAVPVLFLAAAQSAMAEVPAAATAALTSAQADGVTIGGIVLGVIIAIGAFRYLRKAL
jgi:hypothetical protein